MRTKTPQPPKSAARLAAEAAFVAPNKHAEQVDAPDAAPALVLLRRSRLPPGPGGATGAPGQAASATPTADTGPRVFRVAATQPVPPAAPAPQVQAEPVPAAAARTRRVRAERRPSAVVVVQAAAPRIQQAQATSEAPQLRPDALRAELQRAGALLEMAERAQSFRIDVPAFDREWERLSKRAEQLLKELQAQQAGAASSGT